MLRIGATQLVYIEDLIGEEHIAHSLECRLINEESDPLMLLQDSRMRQTLVDGIAHLPEREQFVMSMYYEQGLNLKEIAAVLGVTESRVCQLHSQSIARLRGRILHA
jgi:RNA polymerase sigma factor FliA